MKYKLIYGSDRILIVEIEGTQGDTYLVSSIRNDKKTKYFCSCAIKYSRNYSIRCKHASYLINNIEKKNDDKRKYK